MQIQHPIEARGLGTPPYRFTGYQEVVHSPVPEIVQPGASCDFCSTPIRHVYWFTSADEQMFKLGCDCAEKARIRTGEEWKRLKREMLGERRAYERAAERRAREEREREANGGYTNREVRAARDAELAREREELEAQRAAERAASRYVGTIGERRTFELTHVFSTSWESMYGVQTLSIYKDKKGNFFKHISSGARIARRGQTVRVKATIKDHSEYEGCAQTVLTRPHTRGIEILHDTEED